jgi:hypothetical protein
MTVQFECKQAFGTWHLKKGQSLQDKRCAFGCTCNGQGIKVIMSKRDKPKK